MKTVILNDIKFLIGCENQTIDIIVNPLAMKMLTSTKKKVIIFNHPSYPYKKQIYYLPEVLAQDKEHYYAFASYLIKKVQIEIGYYPYQYIILQPDFVELEEEIYYSLWLEEGLPIEEVIGNIYALEQTIYQKVTHYSNIQFIFDSATQLSLQPIFLQEEISNVISLENQAILSSSYHETLKDIKPFRSIIPSWVQYTKIGLIIIILLICLMGLLWFFSYPKYLTAQQFERIHQVIKPISLPYFNDNFVIFKQGHCYKQTCYLHYEIYPFVYEKIDFIEKRLQEYLKDAHMYDINLTWELPSLDITFAFNIRHNFLLLSDKNKVLPDLGKILSKYPFIMFIQDKTHIELGIPRIFFEKIWQEELKNLLDNYAVITDIYYTNNNIWLYLKEVL